MRKPFCRRRIVALAAAYLVVLQALLLPLAVAAGSPFLGPPCSTPVGGQATQSPNQLSGQPVKQDTGCPCAAGCGMQCCVQALAVPAPAFAERVPVIAYATAPALTPLVLARTPIRSPSIPRAPPAV